MREQTFIDAFPEFSNELRAALIDAGRPEMAEQLAVVAVERITQSESGTAAYIYVTEFRPLNMVEHDVIGVKHGESIRLDLPGMVIVDLDNFGRLGGIELLDRPDVFRSEAV